MPNPYLVTEAANAQLSPATRAYFYHAPVEELKSQCKALAKAQQLSPYRTTSGRLAAAICGSAAITSIVGIPLGGLFIAREYYEYRQQYRTLLQNALNVKFTLHNGVRNFDPNSMATPTDAQTAVRSLARISYEIDPRHRKMCAFKPMLDPDQYLTHLNNDTLTTLISQFRTTVSTQGQLVRYIAERDHITLPVPPAPNLDAYFELGNATHGTPTAPPPAYDVIDQVSARGASPQRSEPDSAAIYDQVPGEALAPAAPVELTEEDFEIYDTVVDTLRREPAPYEAPAVTNYISGDSIDSTNGRGLRQRTIVSQTSQTSQISQARRSSTPRPPVAPRPVAATYLQPIETTQVTEL